MAGLVLPRVKSVLHIAQRFSRCGSVPLQDLIQEGNLGLMRAVWQFRSTHRITFAIYCLYWIEKYIRNALRQQGSIVRMPKALFKLVRWSEAECRHNAVETALEARTMVLLEAPGAGFYLPSGLAQSCLSLNSRVWLGDQPLTLDEYLQESIQSPTDPDFGGRREEIDALFEGLQRLPERDREIMYGRFGLGGYEKEGLRQLSQKYGLSPQRILQIQDLAYAKLRWTLRQRRNLVLQEALRDRAQVQAFFAPKPPPPKPTAKPKIRKKSKPKVRRRFRRGKFRKPGFPPWW